MGFLLVRETMVMACHEDDVITWLHICKMWSWQITNIEHRQSSDRIYMYESSGTRSMIMIIVKFNLREF